MSRAIRREAWLGALAGLAVVTLAVAARLLPPSSAAAPTGSSSAPALPPPAPVAPAWPGATTVRFVNAEDGWVAGVGLIAATTDGGRHWARQYTGGAWVWGLDFVNPLDGWADTDHGLLRTVDGGRTWVAVGPRTSPTSPVDEAVDEVQFVTPRVGWGYRGTGPNLVQTEDGGVTWTPVGVPAQPLGSCLAAPGDGWIGHGRTLYHTTDGGRTWTAAYTADLPAQPPAAGGPSACGPGWVWAQFSGRTPLPGGPSLLVRSADGGRDWQPVLATGVYNPRGRLPVSPQLFFNGAAALDGRTAFVLTVCGPMCDGPPDVLATSDGGRSWRTTPIPGVSGIGAVSFPDARHGFAATVAEGHGGPVIATADGGRTWRQVYPPALTPEAAVDFVSPSVGYGLGQAADPGAVLRTADGGRTWTQVGELPPSVVPTPMQPAVAQVLSFTGVREGWVVGPGGRLEHTVDGGAHWRLDGGAGAVAAAGFVTPEAGCVQTAAGAYLATRDGGAGWHRADGAGGVVGCAARLLGGGWAIPAGGTLLSLAGPGGGWAAVGGLLVTTRDGGRTWGQPHGGHVIIGRRAYSVRSLSFADAEDGWILTQDRHLLRTADGGGTWVRLW